MPARTLIPALLFALLSPAALAKSPKKMTETELLSALSGEEKASKRIDAAVELGAREAQGAIGALETICGQEPDVTVCAAALDALVAIGGDESWAALQAILERGRAPHDQRQRALAVLLDRAPTLFDGSSARLVADYRNQEPPLAIDVMVAVRDRRLEPLTDGVMFAALDTDADRAVRLAAVDTAEAFAHPQLYRAWLSFMGDPDRELRVRCVEGLKRSDLPPAEVIPVLMKAASEDPEGSVRAGSLIALRAYTHPALLPLVHDKFQTDRHPFAWEESYNLLIALANETSPPVIHKVLDQNEFLKLDKITTLIDLLTHIGDLESIGPIRAVEQRFQNTDLAEHCRDVVDVLEEDIDIRELPDRPAHVNVREVDPDSTEGTPAELTVRLAAGGVLEGLY